MRAPTGRLVTFPDSKVEILKRAIKCHASKRELLRQQRYEPWQQQLRRHYNDWYFTEHVIESLKRTEFSLSANSRRIISHCPAGSNKRVTQHVLFWLVRCACIDVEQIQYTGESRFEPTSDSLHSTSLITELIIQPRCVLTQNEKKKESTFFIFASEPYILSYPSFFPKMRN